MFKVNYPANVLLVTDEMGNVVRWDYLEQLGFNWEFFLRFDPKVLYDIPKAVSTSGMDSHNALLNL